MRSNVHVRNTSHILNEKMITRVLAIEVSSQLSHYRMCLDCMNNDVICPSTDSNVTLNIFSDNVRIYLDELMWCIIQKI